MMSIGGTPTANQARLLGNRFHMLPVANPARHRQRQDRFVDTPLPDLALCGAFSALRVAPRLPAGLAKGPRALTERPARPAWHRLRTRLSFEARTRCAQSAASSAELRSFSWAINWSRNAAEASGSSVRAELTTFCWPLRDCPWLW